MPRPKGYDPFEDLPGTPPDPTWNAWTKETKLPKEYIQPDPKEQIQKERIQKEYPLSGLIPDLVDDLGDLKDELEDVKSIINCGVGDVTGPNGVIDGNLAVFDGTSGTLLKDGGVPAGGGDVVGPAGATDNHLAVFNGATGKLIKDGGVIPAGGGDVVGPAGATDGHLAVFDTATGKLLKDGGAVPAGGGDVIGPATNTDHFVPKWNGADSKTLENGFEVVTTVDATGSDVKLPTEQAVREAITSNGPSGQAVIAIPPALNFASTGTGGTAGRAYAYQVDVPGKMKLRGYRVRVGTSAIGTVQWGLFDASANAAAATKIAGGSGALGSTGWQTIAATGAPVSVAPGSYIFVILLPNPNQPALYFDIDGSTPLHSKLQSAYAWDDTPDFTAGWTQDQVRFVGYLYGDTDGSNNSWI